MERIHPAHDEDWLILAGDISERLDDIEENLAMFAGRFARVIWVPGNHELWTIDREVRQLPGPARYDALIEFCRGLGILTPEDPYPVWRDRARIAPLCCLYDYSWLAPGTSTKTESLAAARAARIVVRDEQVLDPSPYATIEDWCHERVAHFERRLTEAGDGPPFVLVNHWSLLRAPTRVMTHQVLPQWCGTELTADWHLRFPTEAVVYGHLHIPRTTYHDGVRFEEVSLGYPREWKRRHNHDPDPVRAILRG